MATKYSGLDFVKALFRAVFGLLMAIYFGFVVFQNLFFVLIIGAFFFYIPYQDEEMEQGVNAMIFTVLMVLLLWISAMDAPLGLGYDIGGSFVQSPMGGPILVLLFGVLFALSIPTQLDKLITGLSQLKPVMWIGLLVVIAIIMFMLQPWTWSTIAIVFIGFWLIATLGGSAGDLASRQMLGVIFVILSIVVFASQGGTQVVGELAFGQWWPSVAQTGSEVFGPLQDVFGQIGGTFGSAIQLITNPTGFAQSIMNGTYQADPTTGLAGSYGVEIESFRTTPIYIGQPFSVLLNVKNKGSFEAENISMNIYVGEKTPVKGVLAKDILDIVNFGLETNSTKDQYCIPASTWWVTQSLPVTGCYKSTVPKMTKLDTRQVFFDSKGVNCSTVVRYDMISQYVPLVATVEYDYKVDSSLSLQFYSDSEWTRLEREGQLVTQAKKPSTITSAPVRLNIDAPEQPVREGVPFFLALEMNTPKSDGKIKPGVMLQLNLPEGLNTTTYCTKAPDARYSTSNKSVWVLDQEPYVVLCQFAALTGMDDPSKTFVITANASYRYVISDNYIAKLEFGGKVCCDEPADCKQYNTTCNETINECAAGVLTEPPKGADNYCEWRKTQYDTNTYYRCLRYEGNCTDKIQCESGCTYDGDNKKATGDVNGETPLVCKEVFGAGNPGVCCPSDENATSCIDGYNRWLTGTFNPGNEVAIGGACYGKIPSNPPVYPPSK